MADDINVSINKMHVFIPNLIPYVETQLLFNEATPNKNMISYKEFYTERRLLSDMIVQVDIGSLQRVNSPRYLIGDHQTRHRTDDPNKNNIISIFDNLDHRKYYVEVEGHYYPRDSLFINFEENDFF